MSAPELPHGGVEPQRVASRWGPAKLAPVAAPKRIHRPEAARAQFGARADQLFDALCRSDPAADHAVEALANHHPGNPASSRPLDAALRGEFDGVPDALRALVEPLHAIPDWVQWDRVARAGVLMRRAGVLGGLVLALRSLVYGYASPAGNKPLAMTGRLRTDTGRRLSETARFVSAVGAPGGLRPGRPGFAITIKVRLMHAQVRRLLLAPSPVGRRPWDHEAWGLPINQHDMLSTLLLFSTVFTGGLRALGLAVDRHERDDYVHLWKLVGWFIGVDPKLLPEDDADADASARLVLMTQQPPDDDARALTRALLDGPRRIHADHPRRAEAHARFAEALCRHLVGDPLADQLGLARTRWRATVGLVRGSASILEMFRASIPAVHRWSVRAGGTHWERVSQTSLQGVGAAFGLPQTLAPAE